MFCGLNAVSYKLSESKYVRSYQTVHLRKYGSRVFHLSDNIECEPKFTMLLDWLSIECAEEDSAPAAKAMEQGGDSWGGWAYQ